MGVCSCERLGCERVGVYVSMPVYVCIESRRVRLGELGKVGITASSVFTFSCN